MADSSRLERSELNSATSPNSVPSSLNSLSLLERKRSLAPKPSRSAPELVRAVSPYKDVPSIYDMYIQAVPRPAVPRRFGSEVFQNGVRDSRVIPMDVPAGPGLVFGPGDGLLIDSGG